MRVLIFNFAELGGLGGVEVVVQNLATAFKKRGHETGIIELARDRKPKRILPSGIPVWSVTAPSYTTWRRPRSWASFTRSTLQFLRILREFQPQIVNVHFPLAQSIPVVGATYFSHSWRLVVTIHNSEIRVMPFELPPIRDWQSRLFARTDLVTAVSASMLDDAQLLYPQISKKGEVIHNGVGQEWFQALSVSAESGREYLLFVGRLHQVKGIDLLLQAWQQLVPRYVGLNLWLAGDGEERDNLKLLTERLGIASRVQFMGRKNQQELRDLYHHSRAVILPSRREGLPMTLLEAGACGALRVATRIPGVPDIIQDGVTGFLAEPESANSLAHAIGRSLDLSQADATRIRANSHRSVLEEFSEEKTVSRYLNCFADLSRQRESGPRGIVQEGTN